MLDHYRITRLLRTHSHGCDRRDFAEMASVYAETDAVPRPRKNVFASPRLSGSAMPEGL
jgi:hypothetical protein